MSAPLESPEFKTLYAGNTKDDDGPVIDSFFIETDAPPTPVSEPFSTEPLEQPKKTTRLMTWRLTVDPSWAPVQIAPADVNRQELRVKIISPTAVATDGVVLSSDLNVPAISPTAGPARLLHGDDVHFDDHTGAIVVTPVGNAANNAASAAVTVDIWSVTL